MLDQLLGLIKENSQQAIVQNPAVPDDQNTEVMQTLLGSITGGLQQQAQEGNIQGLMGLLSGANGSTGSGLMNNPIIASIASNAIGAIVQKFGLSSSAAGGIVSSVLPGVIGSLISKVNNPNDSSFDFNSVLGGLLGGNKSQAGASGLDFNQIGSALADGKLDMNDLIRVGGSLMGGGQSAAPAEKQQQGGLDLGGLLGGLFGGK
ncbi:MAG TPA: hypothetical protein VGN64_20925 [Dyadobacter sp.]|jgi:hypothetical protein|nr:hypothetical protein [Dyadobacter sp.]